MKAYDQATGDKKEQAQIALRNRPLNKRLHPPLVFARFDLGSDTLKVRFTINHSFRSTGTHIVHQLVIALLFEHGRNRAIIKKDFPEGHSPILPFRHQNLAQDRHQNGCENVTRSIPHICRQQLQETLRRLFYAACVQRSKHQMSSFSRLERNNRGLLIPDFRDRDNVRILPPGVPCAHMKGRAINSNFPLGNIRQFFVKK